MNCKRSFLSMGGREFARTERVLAASSAVMWGYAGAMALIVSGARSG